MTPPALTCGAGLFKTARYARGDASGDWFERASVKEYLVNYEETDDAVGAHSPDIDGVFACGATRDEGERRIAEALSAHLALLRERAERVPEPHTDARRVPA